MLSRAAATDSMLERRPNEIAIIGKSLTVGGSTSTLLLQYSYRHTRLHREGSFHGDAKWGLIDKNGS